MSIKDIIVAVDLRTLSLATLCFSTIIFDCLLWWFSYFGKRRTMFDNVIVLYIVELIFQTFILGAVLSFWGKIIIDKIIWWRGLSLLSLLGLDFLGLFVLLPMVSKPKRWFWFSLIMYPLQIILSIVVLSLFVLKV